MMGLSRAKREIILRLVRFYAYYGKVYPKAKQVAEYPHASKRTFWRAIADMEKEGFIERNNRYLNHLQISNAYRLDKLILLLVRYIAEHREHLFAAHAPDIVFKPLDYFLKAMSICRVRLRDPVPITI